MTASKVLQLRSELHPLTMARMLWKGRFRALVIWALVAAGTFAYVHRMPSVYSTYALIVVDSPKIPERIATSLVNNDFQGRLTGISQQIQSSARLREIMDSVGLYAAERGRAVPEDLIQEMKRNITVSVDNPGRRANAFRVGFSGSNPAQVAQVANRVANLYVEENFRNRESQAEGTAEFVDAQLQEAKKRLDDVEAAVARYKLEHAGELPQQQLELSGIIGRLQTDLRINGEALSRVEDHRQVLETTLGIAESNLANVQKTNEHPPEIEEPAPKLVARAPKLSATMAEELRLLRTRYSEEHPDVRRLEQKLAKVRALEEETQEKAPGAPQVVPEKPRKQQRPAPAENPQMVAARDRVSVLKAQIALSDKEIGERKTAQERVSGELAAIQRRISAMPLREQELSRITRDYEISRTNYTNLMNKKLAAEVSTDMERRQKSERFTILENARVPHVPSKPNRTALNLIGCLAGLVLGIFVSVLLEARRGVFLGEWEMPSGYPVIGRMPRIEIMEAGVQKASAA